MVDSMKALHIVKTVTGATWAYAQMRVLRSLGIEVTVALPSATEGLAPHYREAGIEVLQADLNFHERYPWRLPSTLRACRQVVEHVRPDVIHSHHVGTTLVARLALGKRSSIPRIFQVPGPLHLEHGFFAGLDIRSAGPQDHWIATCRWTEQRYRDLGVLSDRVFLSYFGTDVKSFTRTRTGLLRKELGVSPEVPLVGMVSYMYAPKWFIGQVRGLKGHEDFIAALSLARQVRPEIRGVIVGGAWAGAGWYENRLRSLGTRICGGSLTFTGTRRDVPAIYPDLDLAVVPSHSENVGGAVEPLLSGVPVVATNVGGLPDLIQDGKTGWLVPAGNPGKLAHAIVNAIEVREEAYRRTAEGRRLAERLFDVERTGREVAMIYDNILSRSASLPRLTTGVDQKNSIGAEQGNNREGSRGRVSVS